jgi:hypothetical protein
MSGFMSSMSAMLNADKFQKARSEHTIFNDTFEHHFRSRALKQNGCIIIEVDTAFVYDGQCFETGIKRNGAWYIPERYYDEKSAKEGHAYWLAWIKENPDRDIPNMAP